MNHDLVIVLDFGGLNAQLIARQVRENNIYCEVLNSDISITKLQEKNPKAIIIVGDNNGVTDEVFNEELLNLSAPILGIDFGYELIGKHFGGEIIRNENEKNILTLAVLNNNSALFENLNEETEIFITQSSHIKNSTLEFIGTSKNIPNIAFESKEKNIYGIKFQPQLDETELWKKLFKNFLFNICKLKPTWNMNDFANEMVASLKEKIGDKKVLCALSGGVDSSVSAVMVQKAVGKNLTCIFVDHGLMRLNEGDEVMKSFSEFGMNVIRVDAEERFLTKLAGVSDPETKRKIIGEEFIRVFEEEAKKIGDVDFLVQGTIYPDIIESGLKGSAVIKSHHNVGGLPDVINFKEIIEPLKDLFKNEVRAAGLALGIDEDLIYRQPFPGPGLAVRVIGDLTKEKLDLLRKTDFIYRDEIKKAGLSRKIWQYFTVLTGLKSVGFTGDSRTYSYTIALRAVNSVDAMTATWYKIPFDVLDKIVDRLVTEVPEINRVVLDITSKPPSTIEWE